MPDPDADVPLIGQVLDELSVVRPAIHASRFSICTDWRHDSIGDGGMAGLRKGASHCAAPSASSEGGRSMAQDDPADLPELSPEDANCAVDWRPLPDRRRLVLRWTLRCLVAGAVVAGAWSLRDLYPRIDLSVTELAKQVQAMRAPVDQPKEHVVVEEPPGKPLPESRPPLDTRLVVRTIPSE